MRRNTATFGVFAAISYFFYLAVFQQVRAIRGFGLVTSAILVASAVMDIDR
jgi:hypothetical protein